MQHKSKDFHRGLNLRASLCPIMSVELHKLPSETMTSKLIDSINEEWDRNHSERIHNILLFKKLNRHRDPDQHIDDSSRSLQHIVLPSSTTYCYCQNKSKLILIVTISDYSIVYDPLTTASLTLQDDELAQNPSSLRKQKQWNVSITIYYNTVVVN